MTKHITVWPEDENVWIDEQDDVESAIYAAVEQWYDQHPDAPAKDDDADEAINSILDVRGLRSLHGGEWSFRGTAEEFQDAATQGMDNWLAEQQF